MATADTNNPLPEESSSSIRKRKFTELEEAIKYLNTDEISTKVRGNLPLDLNLTKLEEQSKENGLTPSQLHTMAILACKSKFGQSVNNRIVHSLIPSSVVWSKTILCLMSSMCTTKLGFQFQALLMRWMIVIYEYIDDKEMTHSMYDIIFHFLDSELMCPYVCHLLYLLTRKEDVKMFRVNALLQLQQKRGPEPYLLGLLSVYKLYCPHLITLTIPTNRKTFFKSRDRPWSEQVTSVQNKYKEADEEDVDYPSLVKLPAHLLAKKRRKQWLPSTTPSVLSTLHDTGQTSSKKSSTKSLVPFAQIKSFKQLLKNLDRVELPSQLAVALKDKNLQHVLLCYPDPAIPMRIGFWLDQTLRNEFTSGLPSNDKQRCEELLFMLVQFSDFLQESVPVCERFLSQYLHIWNGSDFASYIFKLVTRCRLQSFQGLYDLILEPLRKLFFCSSVYFKCKVVQCLTELLRNLVIVEWPRYRYTLDKQRQRGDIASTYSESDIYDSHSVFPVEVEEFSGLLVIQEYIQFADHMFYLGLEAEEDHVLLAHCVMSFFETVSSMFEDHKVPAVELCGRGILYKNLFSSNAMLLTRTCEMLVNYRNSLNDLRMASKETWTPEEQAASNLLIQHIPQFNEYILDFCDCLWRYKAFTSQSRNTVFKLLEGCEDLERVRTRHMSQAFSIHSHPALLGHVLKFQKQTQAPGLRIHPHQIKHHKDMYMEFLNREKLSGIIRFIRTFIRSKRDSHNATPS